MGPLDFIDANLPKFLLRAPMPPVVHVWNAALVLVMMKSDGREMKAPATDKLPPSLGFDLIDGQKQARPPDVGSAKTLDIRPYRIIADKR